MQYAAIGLHELYQSYIQAGFSRAQAFELVKVVLAAGASKDAPPGDGDGRGRRR